MSASGLYESLPKFYDWENFKFHFALNQFTISVLKLKQLMDISENTTIEKYYLNNKYFDYNFLRNIFYFVFLISYNELFEYHYSKK